MIPSLREVTHALYGAWCLARLDRVGMIFFDRTPEGALRSFFAAALVAPGYVVLVLLRRAELSGDASLLRFLLIETIAYVITWTAFALIMHAVAGLLGRARQYFAFLAAYNWSSVIQMAAYLPAMALAHSGILPESMTQGPMVAVTIAVLVYQWFIARTALEIEGIVAVAVVLLDVMMSVLITGTANSMI